MKIKKMSFSDIEETMSQEEMKCIMGGSGTVGSGRNDLGGSLEYGKTNPGGFDAGFWSGSAGWIPPISTSDSWGSSPNGAGGSSNPSNYTKGWTQTAMGMTTNDPNVIKRLIDYMDWERTILHNEPTMAQVYNFVNMDYRTGGYGRLSDGSILAQGMSINHDPYGEFKTIENLSKVMQNFGDSLTTAGFALSATGVGAAVGGPMMAIGGGISKVGAFTELYIDLKSTEPFDFAKWGIKAGLEFTPDVYTSIFSKRAGAIGFDNAMVEMYAVASDRWFDYMGTVRK